jgi:hypothetical protein
MRSISPVDNFHDVTLEKTYLKNFAFDKMGPFGTFKNNTGTGWHCIAAGMGYSSTGLDSSALYSLKLEHNLEDIVKEFILKNSKDVIRWKSISEKSMSHANYLRRLYE